MSARTLLAVMIWLTWCGQAIAADIHGVVTRVVDGDTLTLMDAAGRRHRIRLAGIDAPELRQIHGREARQVLDTLVSGKAVVVVAEKTDRYGRTVGKVVLEGRDINLELIRNGHAWHYRKYAGEQSAEDRRDYAQAETNARKQGGGLWREVNPLPPWDWRRSR